MRAGTVCAVLCLLVLAAAGAWAAEEAPKGAPVSETGLAGRADVVWFEDFESPEWREHFTGITEEAELTEDPEHVFGGDRALAIRSIKGKHGSVGGSFYRPEGYEKLHVRYYLYFPKDFVWGQGQYAHLKLFSQAGRLSGGRWAGYTSAGTKPTGSDKFSCTVAAKPKTAELEFYFYHPDQRGGYGDHKALTATLARGRWQAVESMVRVNTPGKKDGEIACWLDGKLIGEVKNIRFRDIEDLRIRSVGFSNYWGGAGDENTAPVDQVHYMDNLVIATDYIGPAQTLAEMTREELARYDGQQGRRAYVAFNELIYDVADSPTWTTGVHYRVPKEGTDLSGTLDGGPHEAGLIDEYPVVGRLGGPGGGKGE